MEVLDRIGLLCMIIDGSKNHQVVGRTILQKVAYFCKYLGWDVGHYQLHYYGPFSFQLTNTIQMAESNKLVKQSNEPPQLFKLTDKGQDVVNQFTEKVCSPEKVNKTRSLVAHLSDWKTKDIEIAATIDFVHNNGTKKEDLVTKVHEIKSNFDRAQIQKAYKKWSHLMKDMKQYT